MKPNPSAAIKTVSESLKSRTSAGVMGLEQQYSAHNYSPIPVVFNKASGVHVTDPEGKKYFDFLSGYGAVSHGHVHPRILEVAIEQMKECTLSSRAFYNDLFGIYADFITKFFGYEKVLPMNTGAEAVETALKLARRWGYEKKGIPQNQAIIVCCSGNFHGRTFGAISMSDDPDSFANYGPLLPGIKRVTYGDAAELEALFEAEGKNIAGFIAEPIQGEAGIIIPPAGYFAKVRELCTKHNIMMIADEVQSGVGRSGKMLAIEHEDVRPDVVILAKALGAGFMPVSAVLSDAKFMDVFTPGTHGSTFGGNPLACRIAIEALAVMHEEQLPQKSAEQGAKLLKGLEGIQAKYPETVTAVRGRGLFAAMDFTEKIPKGAYAYQKILKEGGVLAKGTHNQTIRLSPPLVINDEELAHCIKVLDESVAKLIDAQKK